MLSQPVLYRFLATCVRRTLAREKPRVVAIAGSVGKTSTKEAIGVALGADDPVLRVRMAKKNYNNELGVPCAVFGCDAPGRSFVRWGVLLSTASLCAMGWKKLGSQTLVLEYATDHPGDIAWLVNMAPPDVAVLTAIAAEHTEFFGSIDAVEKEEFQIFSQMRGDGVAVVNLDDARIADGLSRIQGAIVTYGNASRATVRVIDHQIATNDEHPEDGGLDVQCDASGHFMRLLLRGAWGAPQALSVAAALAVADALDVDFQEAAARLATWHGPPGRTRIIEGIKKTVLLDDTYNASPQAVLSALDGLRSYPLTGEGRRIAALGDMLELGSLAQESHEEIGTRVGLDGVDVFVACGTLAHVMANAARRAGLPDDRVFVFATSEEAGRFLQDRIHPGDVILVKGSQGVRMEKIVKELMARPEDASSMLVRQSAEWIG